MSDRIVSDRVLVVPALETMNAFGSFINAGTHNGAFHADDVLAHAILAIVCELHGRALNLVRTRDETELNKCSVVFDVGAKLDFASPPYCLDHHQTGRAGVRPNGVEYSSAGLVWAVFGRLIPGVDARVHALIDARFIQPVDATDNGQTLGEFAPAFFDNGREVRTTTFSTLIASLNPVWSEGAGPRTSDAAFMNASEIAATFLLRAIASARSDELAKSIVDEALAKVPEGGRVRPRRESGCASASPTHSARSASARRCPRRGLASEGQHGASSSG